MVIPDITGERMNIVVAGHVDHGKSTLVGRLLVDTGTIGKEKIEMVRKVCEKLSKPFEYAFLLDALKDERTQGITIDTARIYFRSAVREYAILDAPGHIEFLRNMITGAARADAALLLIDAKEGIAENSRRHGLLLSMLGIRHIVAIVNKMDLVDYDEKVFNQIREEYSDYLRGLKLTAHHFIPVSAMEGCNITEKSKRMPWYDGPTVLEALDGFKTELPAAATTLRMPVQDVYKLDERRIVAGTVESGVVRVGDDVVFLPSGKTSRVQSIEAFASPVLSEIGRGRATGVTLARQIYAKVGEIMCRASGDGPLPHSGVRFRAKIFWIGKAPLVKGKVYKFKLASARVHGILDEIDYVLDSESLQRYEDRDSIERNNVAVCVFKLFHPVSYDLFDENETTGRFVITDEYRIAGGGTIIGALSETIADSPKEFVCSNAEYEYRSCVLWFTGLTAAGKSTLAHALHKRIAMTGIRSFVLDADIIRHGLNRDLGFGPEDRKENIRRLGEVSKLFVEAGMISLVASISPYREDREFVRSLMDDDEFIEVYVKCPLQECERRDPKRLYMQAKAGGVKEISGISAPYEEPEIPEITLETDKFSIDESVTILMDYLLANKYIIDIANR
jgi:bifunctional enzyme CysN/CysC